MDALRPATNGGWVLGDRRFQREIAKAAPRRAAPLPKGRPRKERTPFLRADPISPE